MLVWTVLIVVAAIILIATSWHGIAHGSEEYERRRQEDSARAWKEYHERLDSDLDWARNSAEKIQKEITQAELKLQDEQREVFRGYTNPEMNEGSPQIASIAKKELVEASKPQETASKISLEERINRVINTDGFQLVLDNHGILLMEFQCEWSKYKSFEDLPQVYKFAIEAGEEELEGPKLVDLEPFPLPPTPQKGEIVNRVVWDRDEQLEKEYKARAHAGKVQAVNPVQGFPHVVSNLKDDHSGPFNDPKMSIHARQYQQRQLVV